MVLGLLLALPLAASTVRIIQTNSAGDNVSIIDPATNKVVGNIKGIEVNHGAASAPDGSRYYISNEAQSTLDVVDTKSLKVTRSIPLSGHPNNIGISKDGTARLRLHRLRAGRRGCHRHRLSGEGEEHPRQRRGSQYLCDARRQVGGHRLHRSRKPSP